MYKLAICSLLAGSAVAFAPSSQRGASGSSALAAADLVKGPYENELGAQAPLGFFDPFGSKYIYILRVLTAEGDWRAPRALVYFPVYFQIYKWGALSAGPRNILTCFLLSKLFNLYYSDGRPGPRKIRETPMGRVEAWPHRYARRCR